VTNSKPWRFLWLLALVSFACLIGAGSADEQGKQEQGKGKKSFVVQVDLKKLPRDLASEVLKYVEGGEDIARELEKKGKGKKGKDKKGDELKGKADKGPKAPKGEVAYAKGKGKGKKGDQPDRAEELERRLDRLFREIDELRRELRRK
jgi:hypothetical protein